MKNVNIQAEDLWENSGPKTKKFKTKIYKIVNFKIKELEQLN